MNEIHQNTPQIIDSNKINETLRQLRIMLEKIKAKILDMKTENRTKEDLRFNKEVRNIRNLMNEITKLLKEDPLFNEKELYDFLTIYDMLDYLFKDKELFIAQKEFIEDIILKFSELIFEKIDCKIKNREYDSYEDKYKLFKSYLNKKEEVFFLNLFEYNGEEDELIHNISNIIGCD